MAECCTLASSVFSTGARIYTCRTLGNFVFRQFSATTVSDRILDTAEWEKLSDAALTDLQIGLQRITYGEFVLDDEACRFEVVNCCFTVRCCLLKSLATEGRFKDVYLLVRGVSDKAKVFILELKTNERFLAEGFYGYHFTAADVLDDAPLIHIRMLKTDSTDKILNVIRERINWPSHRKLAVIFGTEAITKFDGLLSLWNFLQCRGYDVTRPSNDANLPPDTKKSVKRARTN